MLGGFTRSLSALVHFTLHIGAGVDSVVYSSMYMYSGSTTAVLSIYRVYSCILYIDSTVDLYSTVDLLYRGSYGDQTGL